MSDRTDILGTIFLAGFQPFQGRTVNGSQTVAEALQGKVIREHRLETVVFPVEWDGLADRLAEAIARIDPVLILGLGEGIKEYPCFETFAVNEAIGKDERGKDPPSNFCEPADLPVRKTTLAYERDWFIGLPTRMAQSENAGKFLCNAFFYQALALSNARVGFLHLPAQESRSNADYTSQFVPILYRLISKNLNQIREEAD